MKGVQALPKLLWLLLVAVLLTGCYTRPNLTLKRPVRVERSHIGFSAPTLANAAFVHYHFVGSAWHNSYWSISPFWDDEFFMLSNYYYYRYFGLWENPFSIYGGSPFWYWLWNDWYNIAALTPEENWQMVRWFPGPAPSHREQPTRTKNARIRKSRSYAGVTTVEMQPKVEWHAIPITRKDALPERRAFSSLRIREKPILVPVESEVPLVREPVLVPRSPLLEWRSSSVLERSDDGIQNDAIYRGVSSTSDLRRSGFSTGVHYRSTSRVAPSSAARVRKNTKK